MKNFLSILFVIAMTSAYGQTVKDSVEYWVNTSYLDCLDSGISVCHCQEQNKFLMLAMDHPTGKITLVPSAYVDDDLLVFGTKKNKTKPDSISVLTRSGQSLGDFISMQGTHMILTMSNQHAEFKKIHVLRIDKNMEVDIRKQTGRINCQPLLDYDVSSCGKNTLFLTREDLVEYLDKGQISIHCTGDSHHDIMKIENSTRGFFMMYNLNSIRMFREPVESNGQTIDLAPLNECQIFSKSKN